VQIKLHPEILKLLEGTADVEQLVNDIVYIYCRNGFIRTSGVAGKVNIDRIYRKSAEHIASMFDAVTQEFKGLAVIGESDSETLWVPDEHLHDLLEENTEILVMKSPRKKGISTLKSGEIESIRPSKTDYS
jgi:hypothetical protein